MENIRTSISKEEFMRKPLKEQSYLIFGAVQGNAENIETHEKRIAALEKKSWLRGSLTFLIGVITGFGSKAGIG